MTHGFASRAVEEANRYEATLYRDLRRLMRDGVSAGYIAAQLRVVLVAAADYRASLGLLFRCAHCQTPITGAGYFDKRPKDWQTIDDPDRYCSQSCLGAAVTRPRREAVA